MMIPNNSKSKAIQNDNLRSGQASQSTPGGSDGTESNPAVDAFYEVASEVSNAHADIEDTEEDYLTTTQKVLGAAISVTGDFLKTGLTKLLGTAPDVTEEDIQGMGNDVEDKLKEEANNELSSTAGRLVDEEEQKVDERVDEDEQEGDMTVEDIKQDVEDGEESAISAVKGGIDAKAEELEKKMMKRAQEIEIEILEKRLTEKLGKPVRLVVGEDNEIEGIDDLFSGLTNLGGKPDPNSNPQQVVGGMGGGLNTGGSGAAPDVVDGDGFEKDDDGDYRRL